MNALVRELIEKGYSKRTAYRMLKDGTYHKQDRTPLEFDYERETPKGRWV